MAELRPYPFGLDAAAVARLTSTCWRAHDGQWFLKAAARLSLAEAMTLNEQAIASLARIEVREVKRATGVESFDTLEQVADWYRLCLVMFGGIARPAQRLTLADADTMVLEAAECMGEPVAGRSGYGHLSPGEYPPCRGWLERQRAWGEALSRRYRFTVEREPRGGHACRYVIRRVPR